MTECFVRAENPADRGPIAEVISLAFGGRRTEVDMVAAIRATPEYLPHLSLVAEVNGEVVGHCMLRRATLLGRAAPPVLQLGPLSVHPAWQGRGIGTRLVTTAQATAKQRGVETIIVLLGEPEYYPRFGFRPAQEFGIGPDWAAAMVFPLVDDVGSYRGTQIPH
jgi:putative acetyltransferase